MAAKDSPYRDMVETRVFVHWMRTGIMADAEVLIDLVERKFNHNHDERGRFTFATGTTASFGNAPTSRSAARSARTAPARRTGESAPARTSSSLNGFRSTLVQDSVSPTTSNADSYFELNRRQAHLNSLRRKAGPSPDPATLTDLDDFQRRLNANRRLLDERSHVADQQVNEIMRAGLAPVDVGIGAFNIATGSGDLGDYLAVVGAIPIAGSLGKIGKFGKVSEEVVQLGGAHRTVRKLRGYHSHHLVAKKVSPLSEGEGPAIAMLPAHHRKTASFGRGPQPEAYRMKQAEHIAKGDFQSALQMDIDDIRRKFGNLYDDAIDQALLYSRKKGH